MNDESVRDNPIRALRTATTEIATGERTLPAAVFYILAAAVTALDQCVKAWAMKSLQPVGTMVVIPNVFQLTYAENRGMAFSLLEGQRILLIAAALAVVGGIVWAQKRIGPRVPVTLALSLALALGGAVGNLLDRARLGYVVDLFYARIINFPIFNVADSAITCGIALLAWRVATMPAPQHPEPVKEGAA